MRIRLAAFTVLSVAFLLFFAGASSAAVWTVGKGAGNDFATIQQANNSTQVHAGDIVQLSPGNFAGALITKLLDIRGTRSDTGFKSKITSGPAIPGGAGSAGLLFLVTMGDGGGSSVRDIKFTNLEFPIYSIGTNNVAIADNFFLNSVQAVSIWEGTGWIVLGNTINNLRSLCGGGIGIIVGSRDGAATSGNEVTGNLVQGLLTDDGTCTDYVGAGVAVVADFRSGQLGGPVTGNAVFDNLVTIKKKRNKQTVGVQGIQLSQLGFATGDPLTVTNNTVRVNDLSKLVAGLEIGVVPSDLSPLNTITQNKLNSENTTVGSSAQAGASATLKPF